MTIDTLSRPLFLGATYFFFLPFTRFFFQRCEFTLVKTREVFTLYLLIGVSVSLRILRTTHYQKSYMTVMIC